MNTSISKHTVFAIAFLLAAGFVARAQGDFQPRLLPGLTYQFTITKTMGGTNSMKELIPSVSVQSLSIETGAETGDGIPGSFTVSQPKTSGAPAVRQDGKDWKFSFIAGKDGRMKDIKVLAFESEIPAALGEKIFMRFFSGLFFNSVYGSDEKSKVTILKKSPVEKSRIEVTYSIEDEQTNPQIQNPDSQPVATTKTGSGVFDKTFQCFVSREQHDLTRIFVPEDPTAKAKDIVMKLDQVIKAEITKH